MTPGFRGATRREFLLAGAFPWFWLRRPAIAGIRFREDRHGRGAWRFLHIHGDESTARETLKENVRSAKGRTFFIENGTRMAPIRGGRIDPNRMFSRDGAEQSLRRLNPDWTDGQINLALDDLDRDRERFLRRILPPQGGLMVSMHNNARGYSIGTEVPISERVHLPSPFTPHEFALATDPRDFEILLQADFNAVLQHEPQGPEDGSLSRVCSRAGVRYINIEAHIGQLDPQRRMLRWILRNLPERRGA
jgi:hypothetical protein